MVTGFPAAFVPALWGRAWNARPTASKQRAARDWRELDHTTGTPHASHELLNLDMRERVIHSSPSRRGPTSHRGCSDMLASEPGCPASREPDSSPSASKDAMKRPRSPSPLWRRSNTAKTEGQLIPDSLEARASKEVTSTYVRECLAFNGRDQAVEASLGQDLGGDRGLTIMARVRRVYNHSAWDRLIDFGNGEEKENIVINFQQEMMYEVRGKDGKNQILAVGSPESSSEPTVARQAVVGCSSGSTRGGTALTGTAEEAAAEASAAAFPLNEWIHVTLVHDTDGTASIFWNGTCKATGKVWLPQKTHRSNLYVGRSNWRRDPYFNGYISDVHIFDYALSNHEILRCANTRTFPTGERPSEPSVPFHTPSLFLRASEFALPSRTKSYSHVRPPSVSQSQASEASPSFLWQIHGRPLRIPCVPWRSGPVAAFASHHVANVGAVALAAAPTKWPFGQQTRT